MRWNFPAPGLSKKERMGCMNLHEQQMAGHYSINSGVGKPTTPGLQEKRLPAKG